MPDVDVLEVLLYGEPIATLTRVQGDRSIFAFNKSYVEDAERPTLSLSFKDNLGELITDFRPFQTSVMPFFSNLLPEGEMRTYLADRAGVKPQREFFLLWVLGQDLPGAITIRPYEDEALPPDVNDDEPSSKQKESALHFSLAGMQMKFSAIMNANGGFTVPAKGVGGSWIIKLPSTKFDAVPENEYAMMTLAQMMGMDVPEIKLIRVSDISGLPDRVEDLKGAALAVKRFDRTEDKGNESVHIEDFAQVFNLFPDDKYKKASYRNIAEILAIETSEADVAEFIRRLIFNTLIGNADMHIKNWSLIYYDRHTPSLSPAYDFVSTIAYLKDDNASLKFARTSRMDELTKDELSYLASKARLPEKLVLDTVDETVSTFHEIWSSEKNNLTIGKETIDIIDKHIDKLPIAKT